LYAIVIAITVTVYLVKDVVKLFFSISIATVLRWVKIIIMILWY